MQYDASLNALFIYNNVEQLLECAFKRQNPLYLGVLRDQRLDSEYCLYGTNEVLAIIWLQGLSCVPIRIISRLSSSSATKPVTPTGAFKRCA